MMPTLYTLLVVAAVIGIALPVGRRLYPNGSGDAFPKWVASLPNPLLASAGIVALLIGVATTWVSGQLLFTSQGWSLDSWVPLSGVLVGILIALYGCSCFATILLKNEKSRPEPRA